MQKDNSRLLLVLCNWPFVLSIYIFKFDAKTSQVVNTLYTSAPIQLLVVKFSVQKQQKFKYLKKKTSLFEHAFMAYFPGTKSICLFVYSYKKNE